MPLMQKDNSDMTFEEIRRVQERLTQLGFDPGPVDGLLGPRTEEAIVAFKTSKGLNPRPWIGPLTWGLLFGTQPPGDLPWIIEAKKALNRHEVRDNQWLRVWLASDDHALGDPAKLPWCGDFVETAIRLSLPEEPIPQNPYWALNWRKFGIPTPPTYGSIASIKRKGGGHVGFLVGEDSSRYYILGGNQNNESSIVPVDKSRFVPESFRWPSTFPQSSVYLPWIDSRRASNTQET